MYRIDIYLAGSPQLGFANHQPNDEIVDFGKSGVVD